MLHVNVLLDGKIIRSYATEGVWENLTASLASGSYLEEDL